MPIINKIGCPACYCLMALSWMPLLSAPVFSATPPPAQRYVETLGLTKHRAAFLGFEKKNDAFLLRLSDQTIPLAALASITFERSPAPSHNQAPASGLRVILHDGSILTGRLAASDTADQLKLETPVLGTVTLMLDHVAALVNPGSFLTEKHCDRFCHTLSGSPEQDTVYTTEGETVTGILERLTGEQVVVESELLGKTTLKWDGLKGVSLVQLEPYTPPSTLTLGVATAAGNFVCGRPIRLNGKQCELDTLFGPAKMSIDAMQVMLIAGGRWTCLADLEPSSVMEKNQLGATVWSMKKNANVMGGPLTVRGVRYRRGLGVHAYARLTYALNKQYQRFDAMACLDDCAIDERMNTRFGNVVFNVYVDGKQRYTSQAMSWNDMPKDVSVDVTDAETLSLEVDYGAGLHVLDRANWINARLLKKAP